MGGRGKHILKSTTSLNPCIEISLQKSSAFEFLNLTLQTREASGNGLNHWAELRSARKNLGKKSLSLILECLLNEARTYFIRNS
jgi:hypothetical protein